MRDDVFRFPEAVHRDPAVDAWLASRGEGLRALVDDWFGHLRALGPDVRELMHDGCATACVEDVAFAHVGAYTAHVSLYFFRGAHLQDPTGLLEGKGKSGRHVKLGATLRLCDADARRRALEALIDAAYRDARRHVSR